MKTAKGTSIKTTPAGKVRRTSKQKALNIRMSEDELEVFAASVMLDAAIHGGEPNMARTVRTLIRGFNERVQVTAASQEARDGAKVLRKRARS